MIFGIFPVFRYHFSKVIIFPFDSIFQVLFYLIKNKFYIRFIFVLKVDEDFVGDAGDEWQKVNDVSALKLIGGVAHF